MGNDVPRFTAESGSAADQEHQDARVGSAGEHRLGASYRRLAARGLDMFTVLFIEFAIVLLGLWWIMDSISTNVAPDPWGRAFAATVLYAVVAMVYEVVFLTATGQTPGKDLLNLKVVDRSTGETPSLAQAIRRSLPFALLRMVPGVLLGTAIVGLLCPFGATRLSFADRMANTLVIEFDADADADDDADADADDDVDDEAGPGVAPIDRDDLAARYGPRSVRDYVSRWTRH